MYEIHVKGKKKAVLLVLANAVGYTEPEITFEQGDDDVYIVHCEIETKYDGNPFGYSSKWDGKQVNLNDYDFEAIKNGDYLLCFNNVGTAQLSGLLNVEIETLNKPDDSCNPWWEYEYHVSGKEVETACFNNPDFEEEDMFEECDEEIPEEFYEDRENNEFPGFHI